MTTPVKTTRNLLTLADLNEEEMRALFRRTTELKQALRQKERVESLRGRTLGMIFEKSSTRTRVSFEVGMFQLGGHALFLSARDIQLDRGEPIADCARVLSRYVDGLMVRTFAHTNLEVMAAHADIPIINGLSDSFHPCQLLCDLFTYEEHRGPITGRQVAWVGDGNNMANTWMQAAVLARFHLTLASPAGFTPDPELTAQLQQQLAGKNDASITIIQDPATAVERADLVVTDVWTSMGQEEEKELRWRAFQGYMVDAPLMAKAKPDALFMHCLPAHRGEEVSAGVIDGPQSVVWDEAENRLHIQKAILEWLMA